VITDVCFRCEKPATGFWFPYGNDGLPTCDDCAIWVVDKIPQPFLFDDRKPRETHPDA
jgi:hypothetical protein